MPELPDLTVFADNLMKRVGGKIITNVIVSPIGSRLYPQTAVADLLISAAVTAIERNGKELFFRLSNGGCFSTHLMLNGRFAILPKENLSRVDGLLLAIVFEDDQALAFSDFQGRAKFALNPVMPKVPDALDAAFSYDYFYNYLQKHPRKNIKDVLVDQHFVRGIGNAYVDEILWRGKVSPMSAAGAIPEEYSRALYEAIPATMNWAIDNIRAIAPEIVGGEERSFLQVHNPRRKTTDDGEKILRVSSGMSNTYYTAAQKTFM